MNEIKTKMKRKKIDPARLHAMLAALVITLVVVFVFNVYGDEETHKHPTPMERLPMSAPATPAEPAAPPPEPTQKEAPKVYRYELTDAERWVVASVVTAEAGGEPFEGMMAVAQCILQASEDDGLRPTEAVVAYKYTEHRPEPTEDALRAVSAVFDEGRVVTAQNIKYFYAPALVYSEWHESQDYVLTIEGHKFFKEAE
jgi:spore germination cell wall hydrolase CwlJ-like protein